MNIQCDNCGAEHDLDPPAWVLSSGRPFRFRCSVCGHSQMAEPPTGVGMAGEEEAPKSEPEPTPSAPKPATQASPSAAPVPAPATESKPEDDSVFLKQDGKVYLVKDWATLQRWIMERRVGREDLVSEGGVRWEPIGSRPELGSFFAAVEQLEAAELAGLRGNDTPFPTDGEGSSWGFDEPDADEGGPSGLARLDDETEGVPMGLPPLPTEDLDGGSTEEDSYPDAPPSRLEAASEAPESDGVPSAPPEPELDEAEELEPSPDPAVIVDDEPGFDFADEAPVFVDQIPEDEPELDDKPAVDMPEVDVASTMPYVDPTPSMPMFSEDESPTMSEPVIHDTPVFGGREVAEGDLDDGLLDDASTVV